MAKTGYVKIGGTQRLRRQQSPASKLSKGLTDTWKRILANSSTRAKDVPRTCSVESLRPSVAVDESGGVGTKMDPRWNVRVGGARVKPPYIVFTHTHPCYEHGEDDDLYCGWWSDGEGGDEEKELKDGWTVL
jgi:hypothetical protein